MANRTTLISLTVLANIVNTIPRYLDFSPPYDCARYLENYKIYTVGQAFSFTLLMLVALFRERYDKVVNIVLTASFWLSINDLMDELFFDPYRLGINEVIFGVLMILHAVHQYKQYRKNAATHARNHSY